MGKTYKVIRIGDSPYAPQSLVPEERKEIEQFGGELVAILPG